MSLRAKDVFTPNDFPRHSYVVRQGNDLEGQLSETLGTPKAVAALSGPSKAGKTVLIEKVVGVDRLITVSGAEVRSVDDLWDSVLDALETPSSIQETRGSSEGSSVAGTLKVEGNAFLVKGSGEIEATDERSRINSVTKTLSRGGLRQAARELAGTDRVVFIDDFHYIARELQTDIARQVKAAAGKGIRFCLASVPYRSDDAVRSNSELRGRTTAIDVGFWSKSELSSIATTGFTALGYAVSHEAAERFALEACGSPQLMQQICLRSCDEAGIVEARAESAPLTLNSLSFSDHSITTVLQKAAAQTDYTTLTRDMHAGPKPRGLPRNVFKFIDGSEGDVYRALLMAIAHDPPISELSYAELTKRVEAVCVGDSPGTGSIVQSVRQLTKLARETHPDERILEWEDNAAGGILSIVDPYLLFYVRASAKLADLGIKM